MPDNCAVSVTCKLLQPVLAVPKDGRANITIPAGAVVVVRPLTGKARMAEVLWDGERFRIHLQDLLGACNIGDVGRLGRD